MIVPVTATHFKTISNLTKLTLLTANMFIMSFYNIKLRCVETKSSQDLSQIQEDTLERGRSSIMSLQ